MESRQGVESDGRTRDGCHGNRERGEGDFRGSSPVPEDNNLSEKTIFIREAISPWQTHSY